MDTANDRAPRIVSVDPGSAAERCGLFVGDVVESVEGIVPRDIIEWQGLVDAHEFTLSVTRGGLAQELTVTRAPDEPLGITIESAVFDRIHTCDNHCEFCFIYQLPKGMRRSLYTKDDDFRLSFLYGNFTTLTRFTEADLERVVEERLSPLFVSIHAVDRRTRAEMLRNERGGTSLRWLGQLLSAGIEVNAQIVLCPGVNDGRVLDDTLNGLLDEFPGLSTVAVVPLGLSRHNTEARMRVHTREEASADVDTIEEWARRFRSVLGRDVIHAADELYLRAGRPVPEVGRYGDFDMLEDGVGIARAFIEGFEGRRDDTRHHDGGFFGSVDATAYVRAINPAAETGMRHRGSVAVSISPRRAARTGNLVVVTGELGEKVLRPLVDEFRAEGVDVLAVRNEYFGGNTAVAGLLTFEDISRAMQVHPDAENCHFLLPDVCLNGERFLDGHTVRDLSGMFSIEVMPASGTALRARIDQFTGGRQ